MEGKNQAGKKRCSKTILTQYLVYLETLETNEVLRTNKFSGPTNSNAINNEWQKLTVKLNMSGGPQRSIKDWKKVLSDWRCNVRKKARLLKVYSKQTGGGSPPDKPLTDVENRLLNILGRTVINGFDGVPELGLSCHPCEKVASIEEMDCENKIHIASQESFSDKNKQNTVLKCPLKPPRQKATLLGSIKDHLKKYVEKDYSHILGEINKNVSDLVQIEREKLKVHLLRLQLEHPLTLTLNCL